MNKEAGLGHSSESVSSTPNADTSSGARSRFVPEYSRELHGPRNSNRTTIIYKIVEHDDGESDVQKRNTPLEIMKRVYDEYPLSPEESEEAGFKVLDEVWVRRSGGKREDGWFIYSKNGEDEPDDFLKNTFTIMKNDNSMQSEVVPFDILREWQPVEEGEEDYSHTTTPTEKPSGRHRKADSKLYLGRHMSQEERDRILSSRSPRILGRLAYKLAAAADKITYGRRSVSPDAPEETIPVVEPVVEQPRDEVKEPIGPYMRQLLEEQREQERDKNKPSRLTLVRRSLGAAAATGLLVASVSASTNSLSGGRVNAADGADAFTKRDANRESVVDTLTSRSHEKLSKVTVNHDKKGPSSKLDEKPSTPKIEQFSREARTIEKGEGLYQTFAELDIPQEKWDKLMHRVGPALKDMKQVYFDRPSGEYRLLDKHFTKRAALKLIKETAGKIK